LKTTGLICNFPKFQGPVCKPAITFKLGLKRKSVQNESCKTFQALHLCFRVCNQELEVCNFILKLWTNFKLYKDFVLVKYFTHNLVLNASFQVSHDYLHSYNLAPRNFEDYFCNSCILHKRTHILIKLHTRSYFYKYIQPYTFQHMHYISYLLWYNLTPRVSQLVFRFGSILAYAGLGPA
jgi:hypothetical protein